MSNNLAQVQALGGSIAGVLGRIRGLLTPGEELLSVAVQSRWHAWTHRRVIVAATSNRLIVFRRKLLGGFDMEDLQWQDLRDGKLQEGMLAATLSIVEGDKTIVVVGLRKDHAQSIYVACQAQEQAWREKNRVRGLEEMRAQSGGVQVGTAGLGLLGGGMGSAGDGSGGAAEDAVVRLEKAKAMLDKGLISEAEYEAVKARVIEKI